MRSPLMYDVVHNLEEQLVGGFFVKAGPELHRYSEDNKKGSITFFAMYGKGNISHQVSVPHPLGVYEDILKSEYEYYGTGAAGTYRLFNFWDRWFLDGAVEFNLAIVKKTTGFELYEYPGIGISQSWNRERLSFAPRLHCRIGYKF